MYKIYLKKKLVGFVVVFLIVFYYKKFNSRLLILDIKKIWYLKIVELINLWFSWLSLNIYINVKKIYSKYDWEF